MKVDFTDNFSKQAADYARFRPRYPEELFCYLADLCPNRELAWDCGTGNGQCAVSLVQFFESVIATDASEKQLANAQSHERVQYRLAPAEDCGLATDSVDLITVAQALHWFQIDRFWSESKRVLRDSGVIAVWCYEFLEIAPEIDAIVKRFYDETVGPYWDFERKLVEKGYRSVPFPFLESAAPSFSIQAAWSAEHLIGYLRSWSATQKFIAANGTDPTRAVAVELAATWGEPSIVRAVKWPLHLRVGRKTPENS
jgi:SAM-dependent methyltransferase